MISNLAMSTTHNLNLFTAKGGVWDHYIPYMTLSESNFYYNKHFQVEFGSYVQASEVNDPNDTNHPRTLDGIYLCLAPNLKSGYQIMDLWTKKLITITKSFRYTYHRYCDQHCQKNYVEAGF